MKSTKNLAMICAASLTAGCANNAALPLDGPLFCDVEQPRVFPSQAVIDWRLEHDRQNIKKDLKTNTTGARECGWRPTNEGGA
jgi:hypothetical protein